MKRFITNIIIFFSVLITLNILAYWFIAKPILYKGYFDTNEKIESYNKVILGDSHAKAIRQNDLNEIGVFNLAFDSDSYFDMAIKLDYLIRNSHIDTIYLCTDHHTLSPYREKWSNKYRSLYLSNFEMYSRYNTISLSDYHFLKYFGFYLPLFNTKNAKLFGSYLHNKVKRKRKGHGANFDFSTLSATERERRSRSRIRSQFPDKPKSLRLAQGLQDIIQICNEQDKKLIGITFPLTREYLDHLNGKTYGADSLLKANHIEVYDFSTAFPDSTHLFKDQDHVNFAGSKKFVQLFQAGL